MNRTLALAALLCAYTSLCAADLYKCADANAKITWQDRPCDAASKPTAVQPANRSTRAAPVRDYVIEGKLADERARARDREQLAEQRDRQAFNDKCRAIQEEAQRETAWLQSLSEAVRASAVIKIQQLNQRYSDLRC